MAIALQSPQQFPETKKSSASGNRWKQTFERTKKAQRRAEKRFDPDLRLPFVQALAFAQVRAALRPISELWHDHPTTIALDIGEGDGELIAQVLAKFEAGIGPWQRFSNKSEMDMIHSDTSGNARTGAVQRQHLLGKIKSHRRVYVILEPGAEIADDVLPLIDHRVSIAPPTPKVLAGLIRHRLKLNLEPEIISGLQALKLYDLGGILRDGSDVRQIRHRLRRVLARCDAVAAVAEADVFTLHNLPGMGPAAAWGLDLAQDLHDWKSGNLSWRDVDRGLLLYGAPGTGKTIFAKALAATCKVPLIAGSIARWQASGHLGDTLKAMRGAFADAIKRAPSILFVDELDSIGDRSGFTGHNRGYEMDLVNGFLECLDGVDGREGVVVVGACNHPDRIDPAVLRPGRLDRAFEVPLPNSAARLSILRLYLEDALAEVDLAPVVTRCAGWTGAALAQLVRDARRRARKARRPMHMEDLEAGLPELPMLSPQEIRRIAIHEAGHAVVALVNGNRKVERIWIGSDSRNGEHGEAIATGGGMKLRPECRVLSTDADYRSDLVMLLGGIAAEEIILKTRCDGASGGPESDLYRATLLAAKIELTLGFGAVPVQFHNGTDHDLKLLLATAPDLRRRVERRLAGSYDTAKDVIRNHHAAVEAFAERLANDGCVTEDDAAKLVATFKAKLGKRSRMQSPPLPRDPVESNRRFQD